jgi:F1F0 ATPase subunit 2
MNLMIAILAGVGIGLTFFGGLWVSIRCAVQSPRRCAMIAISGILRWILAGVAFFVISRAGTTAVLAAFCGFWLVRSIMILGMGEVLRAR